MSKNRLFGILNKISRSQQPAVSEIQTRYYINTENILKKYFDRILNFVVTNFENF